MTNKKCLGTNWYFEKVVAAAAAAGLSPNSMTLSAALEAGASKEEVAEVIQIATALTAGASMSYNNIGLDVEVQLPTLFSYMCARLISMPVFS